MKYKKEYQKATRKRKQEILNILEETTRLHRKHLVRVLNNKKLPKKRGGSKSKYTDEAIKLLTLVSKCSDYACGELLHPYIDEILNYLEDKKLLSEYKQDTIELVRNIPLGTLKKKLTLVKKPPRRILSSYHNRSRSQLKKVQVDTKFNKAKQLGYIELDFVEHNGSNSSGSFARTLCSVDVFTQYIVRQATLGKGRDSVKEVFDETLKCYPFKVLALHTDNEPNLVVSMILQHARNNSIKISRSRSYRKEDNGHVEQKNGDKVRKLVGYKRYDTKEEVVLLNLLYSVDDLIQNHFVASRRLISKIYDDNRRLRSKKYDTAKTPFERVLQSNKLSKEEKVQLSTLHKRLDRLHLIEQRDNLLQKLRSFR